MMSSSRWIVTGLLFAASTTVVAGCATQAETEGGKAEESVASTESELKVAGSRYLGKIQSGETKSGYYYSPPTYRSYGFDAKGGDEVTVDVKSVYGDAMGWITDSKYNVLAYNDDASKYTLDAKVKYEVPAGKPTASYRIVFRDYDMLEATFTTTLSIKSTAPSSCTYGGQRYQSGDNFESIDGCNTCTCGPSGAVACTKMACTCNPATETHRNYVGTPQQCMVIRYTCQSNQRPFSNSCGCGCETR